MTIHEVVESLRESRIQHAIYSDDSDIITVAANTPNWYAEIRLFGDGELETRMYIAGPIVSGVKGLAEVLSIMADKSDTEPATNDPAGVYDELRALKEQLVADQQFESAATLRNLMDKLKRHPV